MTDRGAAAQENSEKHVFQLTRELELLISGALVFALLQFPGRLDEWWAATVAHVGGAAFFSVFIIYYVGKLVAYGLITAISAHFLLRGFWVAIMSLRSVYPGGIDPEKLDQGEVFRRLYASRLPTLEQIEARADRLAASIFAFIFLFLLLFLMIAVWSLAAGIVALLAAALTGDDRMATPIMIGALALYVFLYGFVASVDKTTMKRRVSEKWQNAALRIAKWSYYPTFNFVYAPVFFTFASNTSRRRVTTILVFFLYSLAGVFMISVFHARGVIGFDSYSYFPSQAIEQQVRPLHYDNLRPSGEAPTAPTIQADVVSGPYLRLFVPYDAKKDNARMRALCPGVPPLRSEGVFFANRGKIADERVQGIAACFERIYDIQLDGKPVRNAGFLFHRHPQHGVAGRLALIPIDSLAAGRHLLTVRHMPVPELDRKRPADDHAIPFWK